MLNTICQQTQEAQQENNIPAENLTPEESLNEEETQNCTLNVTAPLAQCSSSSINEIEHTDRKSKEDILREGLRKERNGGIFQWGGHYFPLKRKNTKQAQNLCIAA